ncbi:hypothetical protein ABER75_11150 [Niallia taxi]|uniref:hypothetical protein n=1 Tax=Niallia taxi TaxID=2499688 RepID=UPI00203B311E|nr:hypothetical protein [Niallia taxi]MCM3216665.1 hypothetical protein [Niallia taxi]
MKLYSTIIMSIIASILFFILVFSIFNGDLTPYFLFVVFAGVIIGLLISIYNKLNKIEKNKNK